MKDLFIVTTDKETSDTLKSLGYKLFSTDGSKWTFINHSAADVIFSSCKNEKVVYTNNINLSKGGVV